MSAQRIAILLVAASLLVACQPADGDVDPRATAMPAEATPVPGGRLIAGVYGEPATFDPYSQRASDLTRALARPLYRSLYRFDDSGRAVPDLVRTMRISGDIATATLARASWSDGAPITSRDVVASFGHGIAEGTLDLEAARPRGPRRVVLLGRVGNWEEALARLSFVLPHDARPAYSGPFSLGSRVDGLQMVLRRNPVAVDPPLPDRLTIRFTEGADMLVALLEADDIDVAWLPSTVNITSRLDELELNYDDRLGWETVVLDLTGSDLARPQRRAVAGAIDRAAIAEAFVRDDGRVADTLTPSPGGTAASDPFESVFRGGADVDDVPFRLAAPGGDELLELIQRLAQVQLSGAGFDVELINVDARRFYGDWGRNPPVDGALRRRAALPGAGYPSPGSLRELPLFHVDTVLAWREGVGGVDASVPVDGPFAEAHQWHVPP